MLAYFHFVDYKNYQKLDLLALLETGLPSEITNSRIEDLRCGNKKDDISNLGNKIAKRYLESIS